jgi:hypothetical protein
VWSNAVHGVQCRGLDCFFGDEEGGGDQNNFLSATLTFKEDERFKVEQLKSEQFKAAGRSENGIKQGQLCAASATVIV